MDYRSEYKGRCITCENYKINDKCDVTVKGYRCSHHHRSMAMDESCSSYEFSFLRSNSSIEEAIEYIEKRGYDPSPDSSSCYITSLVCKILGYDDNCEYLTNFRDFRDNYMVNTTYGLECLCLYDIYGVEICKKLEEHYNSQHLHRKTYDIVKNIIEPDYLQVVNEDIKNGEYEKAIKEYVDMTNMLMKRYGIYPKDIHINIDEVDKKEVGHGRVRSLKSRNV